MTRLEKLREELETVKRFKCLSFDLKDELMGYYTHEIICITAWHAANPEIKEDEQ